MGETIFFLHFSWSLNRETGLACCNFAGGKANPFLLSPKIIKN